MTNTKKHPLVNTVLDTNYGKVLVLDYKNSHNVKIKFIETGTIKTVVKCNLLKGNVKDPYFPSIYGVGYLGKGVYSPKEHKEAYATYINMFSRCYSKTERYQPYYADCEVAKEWHNFQNFAHFYENNYPRDGGVYHLDKDIKVEGNKVYSSSTCLFVSAKDNVGKARCKTYVLKNPLGEEFLVGNLPEFCKKQNLKYSATVKMINEGYQSKTGWSGKVA